MSAPETAAEAIEFLVSHPSVPILSAASLVRDELERLQAENARLRDDYAGAVGYEWDGS